MHALILVDIQNDFMPDGALPVPGAYDVVPVANALIEKFDLVVATQDWHPANHKSFASNHPGRAPGDTIDLDGLDQILWPDHCVQNTHGAEFVPGLNVDAIDEVFRKGTDLRIDSYSGFFDNGHRRATGLAAFLKKQRVDRVVVAGVATDYCVKWTALDALREGFNVAVVLDGCRGVEMAAGDTERAVAAMRAAGARIVTSREIEA